MKTAWGFVAACLSLCSVGSASAQEESAPRVDDCVESPAGFMERDTAFGSFDGARTELCRKGFQLGALYTGDMLANATGGLSHGFKAEGRTEFDLDLDLDKMAELSGLTAHASAMWIYGGRMSGQNIGNLMTISNLEAIPSLRLHTLWAQQNLWDDAVSFRLGQIAADDEFAISKTSAILNNSTFGLPFYLSGNLPSGGPGFPLPTPGARIKVAVSEQVSVMGAAFSGDPAGKFDSRDPQWRNHDGTTFSFSRGTLYMLESAWARNQGKDDEGLLATYKLGAWYHSARFNDLHFDNTGKSLADPSSTGVGAPVRGNGGVYFVVDQQLIREDKSSDQGLTVFMRGGISPQDRNQVPWYLDGGFAYKGLIEGREADALSLGVAYAPVSEALVKLDRDTRVFNTQPNRPVRDAETVVELTYESFVTPWLVIQPDLQYVIHPGGYIPNPNTGTQLQPIRDVFVYGARTIVKF